MRKAILLLITILMHTVTYSQLIITDGTDVFIEQEANLYVSNGIVSDNATLWNYGIIDLKGNLVNNTGGLFNASSTGTFKFNGLNLQEVTGNHDAGFYGITEIDNSNGLALSNTYSGAHQTINGELNFINGKLFLNEFNLELGTLDPTGIMPDQYIVTNSTGKLNRNVPADGTSTVFFPVGNSTYNPVLLLNTVTATTDTYGVQVKDQEPAGLSSPYFIDRSWIIEDEVPGGSDLTVIPYWNAGEENSEFNHYYSAVGRVSSPTFDYEWSAFGASSGEDPYFRTGEGFEEAGVFAVGNLPPMAICQDVTVSADAYCDGYVTAELVDDGSYDPDGYPVVLTLDQYGPMPLGDHLINLTATDPGGAFDQCEALVTVIDDTPPVITAQTTPFILWPINLQYETYYISDFVLSVDDNCSILGIDNVMISSATSDEPDAGGAYGNKPNDMVIAQDCKSIQLRRERFGGGNGRVYNIFLELMDDYGNVGYASCQVQVPKKLSQPAIDDGMAHQVFGDCGNKSVIVSENNYEGSLKAYPNPFRDLLNLVYHHSESGPVQLTIFNKYGVYVDGFNFGLQPEGIIQYVWTPAGLPSGIYLMCVKTRNEVITKKVVKIK